MIWSSLALLIFFLVAAVPVGIALGLVGLFLNEIYSPLPLTRVLGSLSWTTSSSFLLVAIPFFILIGEILLRAGMATRMYRALAVWVTWLPGGLLHSNIASCTLFAATSGSSVATAATVGKVALHELQTHGYNERLFLGTLAAGGTLGILIPPSINMVVYGMITNTSIPRLYLAAIVPGLGLALMFSLTIGVLCFMFPKWGGRQITAAGWNARVRALPDLLPPLAMFAVVVGSIYAGLATATEAAGLGVVFAIALAAWFKQLNWNVMREAFEGTMRTTGIIFLVLLGAYFLNFVLNAIGLTSKLNGAITALEVSPMVLLISVVVFYLVLGMFMDELSMMVATVPIITPIVVKAGFDPVWFGVVLMLLLQAGMILPPVGINLFVIQGVRGRGDLTDVIIGVLPFVAALLVMVALLVMLPGIALWLPALLAQ